MSEFRKLLETNIEVTKQKILEILCSGSLPQHKDQFGAYMAMTILKYNALNGRSMEEAREIKINTFKKYRSLIANTVTFRADDNVVSFKYHMGRMQDLNEQLSAYFKGINFDIQSVRKTSMDTVFSGKEIKIVKRSTKLEGSKLINEAFSKLVTLNMRLGHDIVVPVMKSITDYTKSASTNAEYSFMFLLTVYNCCRQSDLKNLDPETFEIIHNTFLGRMIRALVTDTKTRKARFIYFYPVAGPHDPILALHYLLCETKPKMKSLTSNIESDQQYQLLRENLVTQYDRFLAKRRPLGLFGITHGPKSHFGRHLMTTYLSTHNLGELVTPFGNWCATDDLISSKTARSNYGHRTQEIPDHLFGFLSDFYRLEDGKYVLVDQQRDPKMADRQLECSTTYETPYGSWQELIKAEVLSFVWYYSQRRLQQAA
uniref:Evolved site-specific tyrosine recombinase n=1 Tax=Torulaspora delbrueckii TaxID=4950 RepID=D0VFU9_TORDE|nr:evolved site-specific tyrosine recombinase [Torulaspora delbrueckii]